MGIRSFAGVLLAALLLLSCGGGGSDDDASGDDEKSVREATAQLFESNDPESCDDSTQAFVEQITGASGDDALAECRENARESPAGSAADSVDVSIQSIDGDEAIVTGSIDGGEFDGATFKLILAEEDGAWKPDALTDLQIVRKNLDRYMRLFLVEEEDLSAREAKCVVEAFGEELTSDEIEDAARDGSLDELGSSSKQLACLSTSSLRSALIEQTRAVGRTHQIDDGVIDCTVAALKRLPDRQVDRVGKQPAGSAGRELFDTLLGRCQITAGDTGAT